MTRVITHWAILPGSSTDKDIVSKIAKARG